MSEVNNNGGENKPGYVKPEFVLRNVPLANLTLNPDNLRFKKGAIIEGIQVVDTYNLNSMEGVIKDEGNIPGIIVVEEIIDPNAKGPVKPKDQRYMVLAGNRRTGAAQEMVKKTSVYPADLLERLSNVQCHVYKNLTERQRRDLVNDQRSQKYNRAEVTQYIWKLQMAGLSFPEIAMHVWQQVATYASSGSQKIVEIEKAATDDDRKKIVTTWLKGNYDNVVLSCGKMGPRVKRAQLLTDMAADGVSPVSGKDDKGNDILLLPEFKPNQARCSELRKAMKADGPSWTAENGGSAFNAAIAKFIREDKGLDADGKPKEKGPSVRTADELVDQMTRVRSLVGQTAIRYSQGFNPIEFADVDAEAFRLQKLVAKAVEHRNAIKNPVVKELVEILLTGDETVLESFLAKNS